LLIPGNPRREKGNSTLTLGAASAIFNRIC
jgi:hypothetical protein